MINCLDYGIHLSEQNGIFNFYYFKKTNQKISNNNSWLNLWEKHKLNSNFLKYYTSKQIAIISPGSKPPYSIYWEVIDKKVWPFEIEIRELSLMNNHKHRFKVGFY